MKTSKIFNSIIIFLASLTRSIDPTQVTWMLLPFSIITGLFFFFGILPLAIIMAILTGIIMALDGFIARKNAKTTIYGAFLNSILSDAAEIIILLGISFSSLAGTQLGFFAIIIVLFDSLIEDLEQNLFIKIRLRGSLNKRNRFILLIVFSILQLFLGPNTIILELSALELYLYLAIFLGSITFIQAFFSARRDIRILFKYKLFNPGPVNTSQRVKIAMMHADISHRGKIFVDQYKILLDKLKRIYKADDSFAAAVISGSATATSEAAISSCVPDGKKLMVISNGAFGERLREIACAYGIQTVDRAYKWGGTFDLPEIEESIKNNQAEIFMVAMVHHETSTSMLNPLHKIGKIAAKYNKYFLADCVSSLGAEDIDIVRDKIDICFAGDNKCLHSFAGASNCCINKKLLAEIQNIKPRNFYLDLRKHFKYAEIYQTPTTPAVNSFLALSESLSEIEEEGLENRWQRYKTYSKILRDGMHNLGLKFFLPNELMSHSVTNVYLPEGLSFAQLSAALNENGFIIYGAKGELENKIFQVANMGNLTYADLGSFLSALKSILKKRI